MSSPLASLLFALLRQMSQENEGAPFVTDVKREAVLRGAISGYYADLTPGMIAIDTNRVGRRVAAVERVTILPPGLFSRFAGDVFWRDGPNPWGITVV